MPTQYSLAHLTVLGCAPPEMTYIAARAGYDFISPRIIMMGATADKNLDYDLAKNRQMLLQTKSALACTGLKVHDIELARLHDGLDVGSYEPSFEVAAELGAGHVISSVWTVNRELALEQFVKVCDLARKYGLMVNLEFVTWSNLPTLAEAVEFVRSSRRNNVGILVDTLHFHRSRVPLKDLDGVPREWLHFIHLCDAAGEIPDTKEGLIHTGRAERLYIGEGDIDLGSIVSRIPQVPLSIELPHVDRVREVGYAEHAFRCLESAKQYFAVHPRRDNIDSQARANRSTVQA